MTTYDEAKRCPKCREPGEVTEKKSASREFPRGTEVHIITCRNSRCIWADEVCRIIQVNPDGSIPTESKARRGSKMYPARPDRSAEVQQALERQLQMETSRDGGEVYKR